MADKTEIIYLNKLEKNKLFPMFNVIIMSIFSVGIIYSFLPCISGDYFLGILPVKFVYTIPFLTVLIYLALGQFYKIGRKNMAMFYISFGVCLLIVVLLLNPIAIYRGALGTISRGVELWNVEHNDALEFTTISFTSLDLQRFVIFFDIVLCLFLGYIIEHNYRVLLSSILLASQCFALILGCDIFISGCLVFTAWFCLWYRFVTGRFKQFALLWSAIVCLLCAVFSFCVNDNEMEIITNFKDNCKELYYEMRYGKDSLPQGELTRAYNMHDNDNNRLQLISSSKKNMYLKGFVGDIYDNGKWDKLPRSAYRGKYQGIFAWLNDNGFNPNLQYKEYVKLVENQQDYLSLDIEIKNIGADRRYLYAPYSVEKIEEMNLNYNKGEDILSKKLFGSNEYNFSEKSSNLPSELLKDEKWLLSPNTDERKDYLSKEQIYRSFVYDNYLDVPEEFKSLIDELFWQDESIKDKELNIYQATERIRRVLSKSLVYEETLKECPKDKEPLRWYLQEYKKGNSPIYASLAVLAFRQKGIPARYVEGYFVNEENQFKENWGSAIALDSKDGHCWAEVYFDGIGWMPVETTDGYYFDIYKLQNVLLYQENKNNNFNTQDNKMLDTSNDKGKNNRREQINNIIKLSFNVFVGILTVAIFMFALIIFVLEFYRFVNGIICKIKYAKMSDREKVIFLFREMEKALKVMNIKAELGRNSNKTADYIADKFKNIEAKDFMRVYQLVEKVVYGKQVLKEYERRTIGVFLRKLVKSKGYLKLREKIILRYTITYI